MEYERHEFTQPLYGGVNVLRIGETLVDTGHVASICRDAVSEALRGPLAGVERVVHTHAHIDHVGGSQTIDALAELPHVVPAGQPEILHDYAAYVREAREEMTRLLAGFETSGENWDVYFPIRSDYAEERIEIERTIEDGEAVEFGGDELEAISTPGHADPHLAFWHEESGTLLSGDLVDRDGLFQYGPLFGDIGAYKRSLERIRALDPDVLVPMHGAPMDDPNARIDASLANAKRTENRLLAFLDERRSCHAREFVTEGLGIEDVRASFVTLVVYEYLRHLETRELVDVEVTDTGIVASR